jgi:predicted nucleic acid-binding protein
VILVDTSVWIDHLRQGDPELIQFLQSDQVLGHPFVTGELALGNLRQREVVLNLLQELPQAVVATDNEVMRFIHQHALFGLGIGFIDAHLLAAVQLSPHAKLWTHDKRLQATSHRLGLSVVLAH